jgi:hypothetical protein
MTTEQSPLQKVIEKVKKLRALASNNQNENEVKAATEAANRLFQDHRLSEAMLEASGAISNDPFLRKAIYTAQNRSSWKEKIIMGLCDQYGACFYYRQTQAEYTDEYQEALEYYNSAPPNIRKNLTPPEDGRLLEYIVCARESDFAIIEYMFNFLTEEGYRLSKMRNVGGGVAFGKSYLEGFGDGVYQQLHELQKAAKEAQNAANSTAMVLLSNRKKEAQEHLRKVEKIHVGKGYSLGGANSNMDARSQGVLDGRRVSVKPQQ